MAIHTLVTRGDRDAGMTRITRYAARMLSTPVALIRFRAGIGLELRSSFGATPALAKHAEVFCQSVLERGQTLVVPDAQADPEFAACPIVRQHGLRFYAGVPLAGPDGRPLGTLCVLDYEPHLTLSQPDLALLDDLGEAVLERHNQLGDAAHSAEMSRRAALMQRLLIATADAPNFDHALKAAASALREATGALYCHVWHALAGSEQIRPLAESGTGQFASPTYLDLLRSIPITPATSSIGKSLVSGEQIVTLNDAACAGSEHPGFRLAASHGVTVQIATPFRLLDEHYAFAVAFGSVPSDLDGTARLLSDATVALRPLLRRRIDESSASLFRRVVEATSDAVLITDSSWIEGPGPIIIYANQAFERDTGYRAAEVLGLSPRLLQGPGTDRRTLDEVRKALQAWQPIRREVLNYMKDGSARVIELNIAPVIDSSGICTHYVSLQRDVTDLKTAEEARLATARELETLIGTMPGALLRLRRTAERDWTVTYASPSIRPLTGHSAETINDAWLRTHVAAADQDRLGRQMLAALEGGQATMEFEFRHADGRTRVFFVQMRRNPSAPKGEEVIMAWTDMTREREMAAQLDQAAKLAQLGEVAAGIAHEMSQPLAGISLAAENALRSLDRAPADLTRPREKLNLIVALATRATEIIDHMRVFGRRSSGSAEPVCIGAVIDRAALLLQSKLHFSRVSMIQSVAVALPPVMGRMVPLEQVMLNLIVNACDAYDAMPQPVAPAQRIIRVRADRHGDRVRITVQDQAGGIPPAVLSRIFEPFFTTKPAGQGTGLGLSISYGIVSAMNGTLTAENVNGGTVFTISLPAMDGGGSAAPPAHEPSRS